MIHLWFHIIAMACILAFSLYGAIFFLMNKSSTILKVVSAVMCGIIVITMFRRDTYLPFLGYAAFPPSLIPKEDVAPKGATQSIELPFDESVKDGTIVVYWGALPLNEVSDSPEQAYDSFVNSGTAVVRNGTAKITFQCPGEYNIPSGRKLKRHLHYRLCCAKYGMLGPVQTVYVRC